MKIKIVKQCLIKGKTCKAGSTQDPSKADARYLVAIGRAEYIGKPPADNE